MRTLVLVVSLAELFWKVSSEEKCDITNPYIELEGYLGQTGMFPWLGVLRVHLRGEEKVEIAVTGVILIRTGYALVNADDVARIPEKTFKEDTSVMFLAESDEPWYCQPTNYELHPEYETMTMNTIAILELDLVNAGKYPEKLNPVCWEKNALDAGKSLFVLGYNDENRILEKFIHNVHYANKNKCKKTYDNAQLSDQKREPVHFVCCYSKLIRGPCIWENGVILVSNSSKFFNLIGFGVRGPGCASLSRFIELEKYYDWLAVNLYDKGERKQQEIERRHLRDVPLHSVLSPYEFGRSTAPESFVNIPGVVIKPLEYEQAYKKHRRVEASFLNELGGKNKTLEVHRFKGEFEAFNQSCMGTIKTIYNDWFVLNAPLKQGTIYYRIELYDVLLQPCICIRISLLSKGWSGATMLYKEVMEMADEDLTSLENVAEEFIGYDFNRDLYENPKFRPHSRPLFIHEPNIGWRRVKNYDLYLHITWREEARLVIEMYGNGTNPTRRRSEGGTIALTPEEERLEYLRKKRQKLLKPLESNQTKDPYRHALAKNAPGIKNKKYWLKRPKLRNPNKNTLRNRVIPSGAVEDDKSLSTESTLKVEKLPLEVLPSHVEKYVSDANTAMPEGSPILLEIIIAVLNLKLIGFYL